MLFIDIAVKKIFAEELLLNKACRIAYWFQLVAFALFATVFVAMVCTYVVVSKYVMLLVMLEH